MATTDNFMDRTSAAMDNSMDQVLVAMDNFMDQVLVAMDNFMNQVLVATRNGQLIPMEECSLDKDGQSRGNIMPMANDR